MKNLRLFTLTLSDALLLALATPGLAKEKEKTITGEAKCAKCAMHETDQCQTAIEAENKSGKKVTYYLVNNDVAKGFHKNVCKENKKVTATGTIKKTDGKMEMTATKIEEAK